MEQLKKHCSRGEPYAKPGIVQALGRTWLVATEGHYVVAVESEGDDVSLPMLGGTSLQATLEQYLCRSEVGGVEIPLEGLRAWLGRPQWEHEAVCAACGGSVPACKECGGEGEVECICPDCDDEHTRECGECEGEGRICKTCGSKGRVTVEDDVRPGRLGSVLINRNLLARALQDFEGVAWLLILEADGEPVMLRGQGWRVVVMPMRASPFDPEWPAFELPGQEACA